MRARRQSDASSDRAVKADPLSDRVTMWTSAWGRFSRIALSTFWDVSSTLQPSRIASRSMR